ncbi:MAG: hypothetical protein O3A00_22395 [Planctomycetota bacterium]|nr:hypothetical protein [Planctomycetota bacterium]
MNKDLQYDRVGNRRHVTHRNKCTRLVSPPAAMLGWRHADNLRKRLAQLLGVRES